MNILTNGLSAAARGKSPIHTYVSPHKISSVPKNTPLNGLGKGLLKCKFHYDDIDPLTNKFIPNANQRVVVYERYWGIFYHQLGYAKTNSQGQLNITFDLKKGYLDCDYKFYFELTDKPAPFSKSSPSGIKEHRIVQTYETVFPKNTTQATLKLQANFANQDNNLSIVSPPPTTHFQSYTYFFRMGKGALPEIIKALAATIFSRFLSTAHIQKIFNSFGKQYPKMTLTPKTFVNSLMNGICNVGYSRNGNEVIWNSNWDKYKKDRIGTLSTAVVNAKMIKNSDGKEFPLLSYIALKFDENPDPQILNFSELIEHGKITLEDGEMKCSDPKTSMRVNYFLKLAFYDFAYEGEIKEHLARHMITGTVATPFFKYISKSNPIFNALSFFLYEAWMINYVGGANIIFGLGSSTASGPLSPAEVERAIKDGVTAKANWVEERSNRGLNGDLHPPLCEEDYYNSFLNMHYNTLHKYFSSYVYENENGIRLKWREIYNWSLGFASRLSNCPKITTNPLSPDKGDIENLISFMTWITCKASFEHFNKHTEQYPLLDLSIFSMGMTNYGKNDDGTLDPFGRTINYDSIKQLLTTGTLLSFELEPDSMVKNQYNAFSKALITEIQANIDKCKHHYNQLQKLTPSINV